MSSSQWAVVELSSDNSILVTRCRRIAQFELFVSNEPRFWPEEAILYSSNDEDDDQPCKVLAIKNSKFYKFHLKFIS